MSIINFMKKKNILFEVGETYETQAGEKVKVLGLQGPKGFETMVCSDGVLRYNRSTGTGGDHGRVTGTEAYFDSRNFKRKDKFVWVPTRYSLLDGSCHIDCVINFKNEKSYVIRKWVEVLNTSLEWEFEPQPSSRTEEFLKRTRFPTISKAKLAFEKYLSNLWNSDTVK